MHKRILIVTDSAALDGGVSQVAIRSAVGLVEGGAEVYFFAAVGPADQLLDAHLQNNVFIINQFDIRTDPNRFRAAVNGIINLEAPRKMAVFIETIGRENLVIHVHGWCKALSASILDYIVSSGIPYVLTVHEYFLACPNGGFYDFKKGEICERIPLSLSCLTCNCDARRYADKVWRVMRTATHKYVMRIPAKWKNYIIISPLSYRTMEPFLPRDANIFEVKNPISVDMQERARVENQSKFLFVGRLSPEKGVLLFAEAARLSGKQVIFVGDGYLREKLKKIIPTAIFTGWLGPQEVISWMRRSRMVVFPSTWYETLGLVPIEAGALGVPSIISDCTAACDFLPNGIRSITFRHSNSNSLSEALAIAEDSEIVEKLSRNVYEWYWRDPWSIARHISALNKVYEEIIDLAARAKVNA